MLFTALPHLKRYLYQLTPTQTFGMHIWATKQTRKCHTFEEYHNFINMEIEYSNYNFQTEAFCKNEQWETMTNFQMGESFLYKMNLMKHYKVTLNFMNVLLPVLLNYLWFLKYELSFLVLLGCLVSSFILPPQHLIAIRTMDISNSVKASNEMSVFSWPCHDVHCVGEQKGSAMSSLI